MKGFKFLKALNMKGFFMISVKELISKIRVRLRDESEGEFRFKDSEILDALNSADLFHR